MIDTSWEVPVTWNILPVEADRQKTKSLISISASKYSREVMRPLIGKTKYWKSCEKREHPLRKYLPEEDAVI